MLLKFNKKLINYFRKAKSNVTLQIENTSIERIKKKCKIELNKQKSLVFMYKKE